MRKNMGNYTIEVGSGSPDTVTQGSPLSPGALPAGSPLTNPRRSRSNSMYFAELASEVKCMSQLLQSPVSAHLGSGAQGVVYQNWLLGVEASTRMAVAIKLIPSSPESDSKTSYNEIEIHEKLTSDMTSKESGIAKLIRSEDGEAFISKCDLVLNKLDLETLRRDEEKFKYLVVNFLESLCRTLDNLNKNKFVHGDIKPQNIGIKVDEDGDIYFVAFDLGIARSFEVLKAGNYKLHGTPACMSPEVAMGEIIDSPDKIDIYGYSRVLGWLLGSKHGVVDDVLKNSVLKGDILKNLTEIEAYGFMLTLCESMKHVDEFYAEAEAIYYEPEDQPENQSEIENDWEDQEEFEERIDGWVNEVADAQPEPISKMEEGDPFWECVYGLQREMAKGNPDDRISLDGIVNAVNSLKALLPALSEKEKQNLHGWYDRVLVSSAQTSSPLPSVLQSDPDSDSNSKQSHVSDTEFANK